MGVMPLRVRIVQPSPLRRVILQGMAGPTFGGICRGIGTIRSFRVQLRSGRLRLHRWGARLGNRPPAEELGCVPYKEPTMISLRVLSAAAALALVLPLAVPSASFAQHPPGARGGSPGVHPGGGGSPGGGRPAFSGGGGRPAFSGGGGRPSFGGGGGGYRPARSSHRRRNRREFIRGCRQQGA